MYRLPELSVREEHELIQDKTEHEIMQRELKAKAIRNNSAEYTEYQVHLLSTNQ